MLHDGWSPLSETVSQSWSFMIFIMLNMPIIIHKPSSLGLSDVFL